MKDFMDVGRKISFGDLIDSDEVKRSHRENHKDSYIDCIEEEFFWTDQSS